MNLNIINLDITQELIIIKTLEEDTQYDIKILIKKDIIELLQMMEGSLLNHKFTLRVQI